MLLLLKGKITMGKINHLACGIMLDFRRPSVSISNLRSRYEAGFGLPVVSFISN